MRQNDNSAREQSGKRRFGGFFKSAKKISTQF